MIGLNRKLNDRAWLCKARRVVPTEQPLRLGWTSQRLSTFVTIVLAIGAICLSAAAKDWEKFDDCQLITAEYRDGDSFHVKCGPDEYIFRLYFVDAPETDPELKDRIEEQAQYFGISPIRVLKLGRKAQEFSAQKLSSRFTVYTKWEDAGGQSRKPRYFAVIKIGKDDLAELLVFAGLARVYGASADMPDGRSVNMMFDHLRKSEARAKQERVGVWQDLKEVPDEQTAGKPVPQTLIAASNAVVEIEQAPTTAELFNVPIVAFLRAEAFVNLERFEEAEKEMRLLQEKYPKHKQKARIQFYLALSIAMQERFKEAVELFQAWQGEHPDDALSVEVEYWMPIAMYYDNRYAEALPLLEKYAEDYPLSVYTPEAKYRAALCQYALEQYRECALALGGWLEQYRDHYFHWEALVTRGDALAAMGELELAKTNYLQVTREAGPFQYLALTQLAKVYKALGEEQDYRDMAAVFARFIQENPDSDQVVDAAYQAGWALRQIKRLDEARKLYWTIVERFGNNNRWEGFQPILRDLSAFYGGQPDLYLQDLRDKVDTAMQARRMTLASRLALAEIEETSSTNCLQAAAEFSARFNDDFLGAEALAFLGDTFVKGGKLDEGTVYLQSLLQRFPQSKCASLAHTRLAELLLSKKDYTNALWHVDRAMENMTDPLMMMEAVFARAKGLEGLQQYPEAVEEYNQIIANRASPRALKPEAMLGLAACLEAQGKVKEAIPYYQRIYVMYQAYTHAMAQAYLRSAEAFEKLNDRPAAMSTYQEMLTVESLAGQPELAIARERMAKLGS